MKFKKRDEPVYTSEPHYDFFDGGYIDAFELLEDKVEADAVNDARVLIQQFFDEAEEAGVIEIT